MARTETIDLPKFKRLQRKLNISRAQVLGHLELLWRTAHQQHSPYFRDEIDVEIAADWEGDEGLFTKVAVSENWVDKTKNGYEIHDYWDNAPTYVWDAARKKRQRGERSGKLKVSEKYQDASGEYPDLSDVPNPTKPNPTKPNPTQPTLTKPNQAEPNRTDTNTDNAPPPSASGNRIKGKPAKRNKARANLKSWRIFLMCYELLKAGEVAKDILKCSTRQIWRMRDSGRMPAPLSYGPRSVAWRRAELEAWIADGCPDVRRTGWTWKPGRAA